MNCKKTKQNACSIETCKFICVVIFHLQVVFWAIAQICTSSQIEQKLRAELEAKLHDKIAGIVTQN